ncbi:MAG: hypothetical protein II453_14920 [Alphaproteobacteria bacterium]|nr:hypothetical protein [Alphaproteobacteria bacterium]
MAKKFSELKQTTKNSMNDLYRGANPETIKMALSWKTAELKELQEFFCTKDIDAIAIRLSTGAYSKD